MRAQELLTEAFHWDSEWDKEVYISLKGLVNKNNGVWKSKKQRDFMINKKLQYQKDLHSDPNKVKEFFGVDMDSGQFLVLPSAITQWAEHGARAKIPVRYGFVLDSTGVAKFYKIGNKGNLRIGAQPDPSKTKLEWSRPENADRTHLDKTKQEKKKEFKGALGMGEGEFVGEKGERLDLGVLELVAKKELGYSQFGYNMATKKYWNMYKDEQGRIIYHTGKEGPERGEKIKMTATVKDHITTKKGDNVTVVIRPRFYSVETNEEVTEMKANEIVNEQEMRPAKINWPKENYRVWISIVPWEWELSGRIGRPKKIEVHTTSIDALQNLYDDYVTDRVNWMKSPIGGIFTDLHYVASFRNKFNKLLASDKGGFITPSGDYKAIALSYISKQDAFEKAKAAVEDEKAEKERAERKEKEAAAKHVGGLKVSPAMAKKKVYIFSKPDWDKTQAYTIPLTSLVELEKAFHSDYDEFYELVSDDMLDTLFSQLQGKVVQELIKRKTLGDADETGYIGISLKSAADAKNTVRQMVLADADFD